MKANSFNPQQFELNSKLYQDMPLSVSYVIESLREGELDTSPPYQRGFVWPLMYQEQLIQSILNGLSINTVHLVKKDEEGVDKWVMDGKQRIETIRDYIQGKFGISLIHKGTQYTNLLWEHIQDREHPCHFLKSKIKEFKIPIVMWEPLQMSAQKTVFQLINNNKSLSIEEQIYCNAYQVRGVIDHIFRECENMIKFLNKKIAKNTRHTGTRMMHTILISSYGPLLDGGFTPFGATKQSLTTASQRLESAFESLGMTSNSKVQDYCNAYPPLQMAITEVKMVMGWFGKIMEELGSIKLEGIKVAKNMLSDYIILFIKKHKEGLMDNNFFEENMRRLHKFMIHWYENKNPKFTKHSTDVSVVREKFEVMENEFNSFFNTSSVNNPNLEMVGV
ncbi:DUF262 domain-containing protein [Candidatus Parcubacteria bacterium]|nr:MAG: DUF262 domain-containing protein [Candidatus Parcubacteria bacterium]